MFHVKHKTKMKNLLAIIVGAIIFFVCAAHLIPSHEPASVLQYWTYGMFGGLGIAAAGVYGLKKDSDNE